MSKIDTNKWKSFVVGDLFSNIKKPYVLHSRKVYESKNGIPYVVRSKFNNGIKCLVEPIEGIEPSPAGVITWGAENASFFYQEKPFYSGRDIYYIDTSALSKETCLFIASCLQTISKKYAYNFGLFPDLLKKEKIKLPVKTDGSPDWTYMNDYIKCLLDESNKRIKNLKLVNSKARKIGIDCWKNFAVKDFFDIHPTNAYKMTNVELMDNGDNPVVVNSGINNGIGGYTTQAVTEHGNMITFSDTTDASTIFYQPDDFVGYPHVQGMYPVGKYADKWNALTYRFFVSVFRSVAFTKGFDYGNKFRRDVASELMIPLPSTSSGNPDWKYMEDYMQQVFDKSEDRLKKLRTAIE